MLSQSSSIVEKYDIMCQQAHAKEQLMELQYDLFRLRETPEDQFRLQRVQTIIVNLIIKTRGLLDQSFKRYVKTCIYHPSEHYTDESKLKYPCYTRGKERFCEDMQSKDNIREKTLEDIWKSTHFQKLRDDISGCRKDCWDSTNAVLSIRFSAHGILGEPLRLLKEINFYTQ